MKHLPDTEFPILLIDSDNAIRRLFGQEVARSFGLDFAAMDARTFEFAEQLITVLIINLHAPFPPNIEQDLEKLASNRPCWIMLDLTKSEMAGFEFIQRLKENPKTRFIPIIVLENKSLSKEAVARLRQANVIFETKQVFTHDEFISQILDAKNEQHILGIETSALVKQTIAYITENYNSDLSRQDLARQMKISQDYLSRVFHKELGISPWEFINRYRIIKAKELLEKTNARITSIATQVGFNDPAYFSRVFQKVVGCSPKAYRDNIFRYTL